MIKKCFSVVVMLVLFLPSITLAADKVTVLVEVNLGVYEDEFEDSIVLAEKVALVVVEKLGGKIGFINLGSGPAHDSQEYLLGFELRAQDAKEGTRLREVGFHVNLSGPEIPDEARTYWMLYNAEQWKKPVPSEPKFLGDVSERIAGVETTAFVERVLRWIRVASDAQISDDPRGWDLPYEKSDLCIETGSRLRFRHDVVFGGRNLRREFVASLSGVETLFCEPIENVEEFSDLLDPARTVSNHRVYVLHYIPLEGCARKDEPLPPDVALGTLEGDR